MNFPQISLHIHRWVVGVAAILTVLTAGFGAIGAGFGITEAQAAGVAAFLGVLTTAINILRTLTNPQPNAAPAAFPPPAPVPPAPPVA